MLLLYNFFFFFQAEDGIRDYKVTGVQTCALPISATRSPIRPENAEEPLRLKSPSSPWPTASCSRDRKSTRLNSSHLVISYAVFCLKKKTPYFPSYLRPNGYATTCA